MSILLSYFVVIRVHFRHTHPHRVTAVNWFLAVVCGGQNHFQLFVQEHGLAGTLVAGQSYLSVYYFKIHLLSKSENSIGFSSFGVGI